MITDHPAHCLRCNKSMLSANKFCPQIYCSNACRVGVHLYKKRLSAKGYPDALITLSPLIASLDDLVDAVVAERVPAFATVYADPPWRDNNTATRGAASRHYATMTIEEIAALPVGFPG